jgi:hypothetical protein
LILKSSIDVKTKVKEKKQKEEEQLVKMLLKAIESFRKRYNTTKSKQKA